MYNLSINSLHPSVHKRNFPCNDDNVAFMQQVHSKTTGKQSVLLTTAIYIICYIRVRCERGDFLLCVCTALLRKGGTVSYTA